VSAVVVKTSESELEGCVLRFFVWFCQSGIDRRHRLESQASQAGVAVLAVSVPFSLESGTAPSIPSTKYPVTFTASFESTSDAAVAALRAALNAGHTVEIDVQGSGEENWEKLEDLLTKATADGVDTGLIILCECSWRRFPSA
jgi:hypothetical protein